MQTLDNSQLVEQLQWADRQTNKQTDTQTQ